MPIDDLAGVIETLQQRTRQHVPPLADAPRQPRQQSDRRLTTPKCPAGATVPAGTPYSGCP